MSDSFWGQFIKTQELRTEILWHRKHWFRSRLNYWLWRILHPIKSWREEQARKAAYDAARRQLELSAQEVINSSLESYRAALEFFEHLPAYLPEEE